MYICISFCYRFLSSSFSSLSCWIYVRMLCYFPESIMLRDDEMYSTHTRPRTLLSLFLCVVVVDVENKWLVDRWIDVDRILRRLIFGIFFRQSFVYSLGRYTNKNASWHIWWRRDQDGYGENQLLSLLLSLASFLSLTEEREREEEKTDGHNCRNMKLRADKRYLLTRLERRRRRKRRNDTWFSTMYLHRQLSMRNRFSIVIK